MSDTIYRNYDNMEILFYEQPPHTQAANNFNKYDRNTMRLNLRPAHVIGQENHRPTTGRNNPSGIQFHHSPDMGIFKIVSPELEKFIGSNTGLTPRGNPGPISSPEFPLFSLVSPEFEKILASIQNKTPTPTRILREGNSVAKQREVYVQGFAEALQHIHDQQQVQTDHEGHHHTKLQHELVGAPQGSSVHSHMTNYGWSADTRNHEQHSRYETISTRENSGDAEGMQYVSTIESENPKISAVTSCFQNSDQMSETDGYQFDDNRTHGLDILPLPPIDLELQEIVKRERKKQKNRVAASKCRRKKLEREAQLEVRVQQLKEKNIELNAVASALRQQAGELKQRVLEHIAFGCQLPTVTTTAY